MFSVFVDFIPIFMALNVRSNQEFELFICCSDAQYFVYVKN